MARQIKAPWLYALLPLLTVALLLGGCGGSSPMASVKKWMGYGPPDEDEETKAPPEAVQEEVVIDGKTYVRSRNPYYQTYPDQPEYIYAEKGTEYVGIQGFLIKSLAKALGREQAKKGAVPPEKLQELVRQEVERVLREQGLGAYVSRTKGAPSPVVGRFVGVLANPETSPELLGSNRSLATAVADVLSRQKDLKVAGPEQVKAAMATAKVSSGVKTPAAIRALGDALGVQALVLTDLVPPTKGAPGYMVIEVYDTFLGAKVEGIAGSLEGSPSPQMLNQFAQANAAKTTMAILNQDWFGRVEFVKEGKVYLSLGQNAGLKAGDRLKVVLPGKEILNPTTRASLGYTADETQGELKVKELLGTTGAVAEVVSGGPFKSGDKVKAAR
jgi:hypothetical protein